MDDDNQNPADTQISTAARENKSQGPLFIGLAFGFVAAFLSLSLDHSAFQLFRDSGLIVTTLLSPGLLGSTIIAQNAHAFSLWNAAWINFVFYFIIVWVACSLFMKILRRFQ